MLVYAIFDPIMSHPKHLKIEDYSYHLPEQKIAIYPLPNREASKLLVYKNGAVEQTQFFNLHNHLPPKSLLIFNNTKVVPARILFQKTSGGIIEIFCLSPDDSYPDVSTAMNQTGSVTWKCLIGGVSKWKNGIVLEKNISYESKTISLLAKYIEKRQEDFIIELSWNDDTISFAEILQLAGQMPLPPYIKRNTELSDTERYQTVYATFNGSVAAPTAGLHFTSNILQELQKMEIRSEYVTLHVGAGTFKPVKSEFIGDHEMHGEYFEVTKQLLQALLQQTDEKVITVGTTTLRTIETLYWLGYKLVLDNTAFDSQLPHLTQWEPYELARKEVTKKEALLSLIKYLEERNLNALNASTQIIIAPDYEVKMADALITNFHQPNSTLLLLVAAFIGNKWKEVYEYALENDFRFLSYGDSSLLWKD